MDHAGRERLIGLELARFLCRFPRALARVHPAVPISTLVKRLKGGSSAVAAKEGIGGGSHLSWAKGYSVDTVSRRSLASVRAYLRRQPLKHSDEAILNWNGDTPEYDAGG